MRDQKSEEGDPSTEITERIMDEILSRFFGGDGGAINSLIAAKTTANCSIVSLL